MLSLILVLICPLACAEFTRFSRQPALENKKINDATSVVMTPLSLNHCVRQCHDNSSCMSFFHNQDGGRCQMLSRLHVNSEESMAENGNKFFAKNEVCPIPEDINNGRVLYTDGLVEGSIAEFVCDDYYFPTTESGICQNSGTWQGLDNACTSRQIPLIIPTSRKLVPGSCFTVIGTPILETVFAITLYEQRQMNEQLPTGDLLFSMGNRFSHNANVNTIVLNSRTNNVWGAEVHYSDSWPFVVNEEFNITICLEETLYRITVDDVEIATFAYRHADPNIRTIVIGSDVVVRRVRFNT